MMKVKGNMIDQRQTEHQTKEKTKPYGGKRRVTKRLTVGCTGLERKKPKWQRQSAESWEEGDCG